MANYNLIVLMGNITKDIELSYTPNQVEVANFGIAVNKKFTVNGEKRESVLFVDCVAFKKNAINLNKYVSKGDPLFITGELQLDTWTTNEGQKRSKHKILVNSFQFISSQPQQGAGNSTPAAKQEENDLGY